MAGWNVFNDYNDRDIDAVNHPHRPIPAGQIDAESALEFSIGLMGTSLLLLIAAAGIAATAADNLLQWLPALAIWMSAAIGLFHYELGWKLKEKGLLGNITVSYLVAFVIIFGAAAVGAAFEPLPWCVAASAFLVNLAREIVKDIEDLRGDLNRLTLPQRIGVEPARAVAYLVVVAGFSASIIPYVPRFDMLPSVLLLTQLPALLILLTTVKIRLARGEDHRAQRSLRLALMLGLIGFLISSLVVRTGAIT
uniref:Prenyltransferase, UbiA family (UbiA) n=1 Tax=uncultured marine group II/III euryarchaeote KM3_80_G12 TaxID=1456515 RepID=A0A075HRF2_9EURY|nr:prenyltransferase, UbiA family (ubiA) [uncultured marine group II/III euryarchaeote KM3_80_G12]